MRDATINYYLQSLTQKVKGNRQGKQNKCRGNDGREQEKLETTHTNCCNISIYSTFHRRKTITKCIREKRRHLVARISKFILAPLNPCFEGLSGKKS